MNKIYICESCRFLFERTGEVDRCPDCGKENVRSANEREQEEYRQLRREFGYINDDKQSDDPVTHVQICKSDRAVLAYII